MENHSKSLNASDKLKPTILRSIGDRIKNIGKSLMTSDKLIPTFLRSIVSSQAASWVDMGSSIGLVALGVSPWLATPVGAVAGGVINCSINYKFTFRASGSSKIAVAVKYLLVWVGSLILNTVGTAGLAHVLDNWHLLETLGFTNVGSFAVARVVVSLLVSWFWNFLLQRQFVYKPVPKFDNLVVRYANRMTGRGYKNANFEEDNLTI